MGRRLSLRHLCALCLVLPVWCAASSSFDLTFDVAFRATNRQTPFEAVLNGGTKHGSFTVRFHHEWAPIGVARVRELADANFFDNNRFYRVVAGFMAQWGLNGDPDVNARWAAKTIKVFRPPTHFSHMSRPTFPISHLLICFFEFRPPTHFSHMSRPTFSDLTFSSCLSRTTRADVCSHRTCAAR